MLTFLSSRPTFATCHFNDLNYVVRQYVSLRIVRALINNEGRGALFALTGTNRRSCVSGRLTAEKEQVQRISVKVGII